MRPCNLYRTFLIISDVSLGLLPALERRYFRDGITSKVTKGLAKSFFTLSSNIHRYYTSTTLIFFNVANILDTHRKALGEAFELVGSDLSFPNDLPTHSSR